MLILKNVSFQTIEERCYNVLDTYRSMLIRNIYKLDLKHLNETQRENSPS